MAWSRPASPYVDAMQRIDDAEIIDSVDSRRAPMVPLRP
jgi:hypothetical protein